MERKLTDTKAEALKKRENAMDRHRQKCYFLVMQLVFLALLKNFSCGESNPFHLEGSNLMAKEGSCIEIKCTVSGSKTVAGAHWFWMKDSNWTKNQGFIATIVYSTDESKRQIHPDYAKRVKYTGSDSLTYSSSRRPSCSILICDLNTTDSGNYSFRFVGSKKWVTNQVILTVTENPCLITFDKLLIVKEDDNVTLTCSTLSSCPTEPKIEPWTPLSSEHQTKVENPKKTTYKFKASWMDDGKLFSCQTQNNTDPYLIRNTTMTVEYAPKKTTAKKSKTKVEEGKSVTLSCFAEGQPSPTFTWFKNDHQQHSGAQWVIAAIQESDSGMYYCESQNKHGIHKSEMVNINVEYRPVVKVHVSAYPMSKHGLIKEGDTVNFICIVERSNPQPYISKWFKGRKPVSFEKTYVVESIRKEDSGTYSCTASNTVGSDTPKEVKVEAYPGLVVTENVSFTLECSSHSYPAETSYTWMKVKNGKKEPMLYIKKAFYVKSASPSDSGLYSCTATNEIGAGESEQVDVKVKYAPKHIEIIKGEEKQMSDGTSSVTLSCSTQCYPQVRQYLWFRKTDKQMRKRVSSTQNFTVTSAYPGEYYCVAENEIGQRSSDPKMLFDDRVARALKLFFLICFIVLVVFVVLYLYRWRRNKSNQQQGAANTRPCGGFLCWWTRLRSGNLVNETGLTEPSRSRDELLPDQPCRPMAGRAQTDLDNTSVANINTVYCQVKLPHGNQVPGVQRPKKLHDPGTEADSLNYTSLYFGNAQKKAEEEEAVYSKVSKPRPPKEKNQEKMVDYENVSKAWAPKFPYPSAYDSDTSEDEVEVNYAQVNLKAKQGNQRTDSSDSSSSENETQYSEVKL
ncbi:B-cell receptor CD22 [Pholidichthys leucotaenia]